MNKAKYIVVILFLSVIFVSGCFDKGVIVFDRGNTDLIVTKISQSFYGKSQCSYEEGCSFIVDLKGIKQSDLLVNDLVADNPQEATKIYGVTIETLLEEKGIYLTRYFNNIKTGSLGVSAVMTSH
jgi:hypothetical protein